MPRSSPRTWWPSLCLALLLTSLPSLGFGQSGDYFETFIPSGDGIQLWVQVFRPAGVDPGQATPAVVNLTPYAIPADPPVFVAHNADAAAAFLARGWTYVQGSLRGFGMSEGCSDLYGPNEQMDAAEIVRWVNAQPWSGGRVATYGASYEGGPQLAAIGAGAAVDAAVIQAGATSFYRALYDARVHYGSQWRVSVPAYALLQIQGIGGTDFAPTCVDEQVIADLTIDDPNDPFWLARDLTAYAESPVPIRWSQGFHDSLVRPDHFESVWPAFAPGKRGALSQYHHDYGRRTDRIPDVIAFLAQYLEDAAPPSSPVVRVQGHDGRWRVESGWPPADARDVEVELAAGSYQAGHGSSYAAVAHDATLWSFSAAQPAATHLSGAASLELEVGFELGVPPPQATVTVYDVAPDGTASRFAYGATLLPEPGIYDVDLHSFDRVLEAGHRIGVAITGSEESTFERQQTPAEVEVLRATLSLSALEFQRDRFTDGGLPFGSVPWKDVMVPSEVVHANAITATLPPSQPHACTQDPERAACPAMLLGSPAVPGGSVTLIDASYFILFRDVISFAEIQIEIPTDVDDPRDLTIWATPEDGPELIGGCVYDDSLANAGREVACIRNSDLWRGGVILPSVVPGHTYWFYPAQSDLREGEGAATSVHIQAVLRTGSATNLPPITVDDRAVTKIDTAVTIDVLANDFDPDGEPVELRASDAPAHGTADCRSDGRCTYTPAPGFEGTDTFAYTACDATGACDDASVEIEVGGDVVMQCDSIDDGDPSVSYRGGWHRRRDAGATQGSYHRRMGSPNTETGNGSAPTASVRFEGDEIVYAYVRSRRGGAARISVDGELVETLTYGENAPGPDDPTFGHERRYSGFGPGAHELVVEHEYGAVYVDGFEVPCDGGSALSRQAGEFGSETQQSRAQTRTGVPIEVPVQVQDAAREISVVVEGGAQPVRVEVLDPLGMLLGVGESLLGGPVSGVDVVSGRPGAHSIRVTPTAHGETLEISVAVTVERP